MTERLQRLLGSQLGMNLGGTPTDAPQVDTAEQVYISSLALLKMLKHGRAGVPMEVKERDWEREESAAGTTSCAEAGREGRGARGGRARLTVR